MGVYQAADLALLPAELALLPAGLAWLAKGPPEETFTLLHAFGIVSLSVTLRADGARQPAPPAPSIAPVMTILPMC
ncbi:hypothetical protein ACU4HD_03550 [Cupriavidus basilensis]